MRNSRALRELGMRHILNLMYLYGLKGSGLFQKFVQVRPLMASIKVTEACNSKCITCTLAQKEQDPEELTQSEITDLLKQLMDLGCRYVRFTGGEPLLRRDLPALIQAARELGFQRRILASNGLLLSKRAKELEGITDLNVSLDGLQTANDAIRGVKGGYRRTLAGIQKCKKKHPGLQLEIATTLLGRNLGDVEGLIQLCADVQATWFVNLFDTNPYFFQGIEPHDLQADDPGAIQEALQVIKREHKQRPECFTFNRKAVSAVESFLLEGTYPRHCILGYTNVDIDPKGGVYSGCWAMKPMGNIREQSLEAILSNPAYTSRARRMLDRHCPQCTCGWMVNTMYDHFFR